MPIIKPWEELTLNDHFIFELVMTNAELCRRFLSLACRRPVSPLAYPPQAEKTLLATNYAKSSRFDIWAADQRGNVYDLELQKTRKKLLQLALRIRHYKILADQTMLKKGQDYRKLRRFSSIFLCSFDPFRQGFRRYTFRLRCEELRKLALPDRSEIIFLNIRGAKGEESADMQAFLEYMATGVVRTPFVALYDDEVRRIKADAKLKEMYMSLAMDYEVDMEERTAKAEAKGIAKGMIEGMAKGRAEGRVEGRVEGRAEGRVEGEQQRSRDIARRLVQRGLPLDLIAEDTGLTVEQVQALKQQ